MYEINTPILIVGAGPTGLTMAMMLLRYGIPFRIIDKATKPVITSNALAVQARTLSLWKDLGIFSSALKDGLKLRELVIHFKGRKKTTKLNMDLLNSEEKFILSLSQHYTESMLIEYLESRNVVIEMGKELIDVNEGKESVEVTLQRNNSYTKEKIQVGWLIACDGIHSTIREKLHLAFQGRDLPQHLILADAEIKANIKDETVQAFASPMGTMFMIPYKGDKQKYWRIIFDVTHDATFTNIKKPTYENITTLTKMRCPIKMEISKPIWTSGFYIHERMLANFQFNRIFFAGDAAHVHSPAGGQGMNTGIQDAYNLGWKLALVIRNKLNPTILETYSIERVPVVKAVLSMTTRMTKLVTIKNPYLIKLRNWSLSFFMRFDAVKKKIVNTIGQTTIYYSNSPLSRDRISIQSGPKAGMSVIDVKINGQHFLDKVYGQQFVLLIFMGINENLPLQDIKNLRNTLNLAYPNLIKFILIRNKNEFNDWQDETIFDKDKKIHQIYGAKDGCLYFVRPDKYIGFRGSLKHIPELKKYCARWFV